MDFDSPGLASAVEGMESESALYELYASDSSAEKAFRVSGSLGRQLPRPREFVSGEGASSQVQAMRPPLGRALRGLLGVVVFILAAYVGVLIDRLEWKQASQLAGATEDDLTEHWGEPIGEALSTAEMEIETQTRRPPPPRLVVPPSSSVSLKEIVSGNTDQWTEHARLCGRLRALGEVTPQVVFHNLHTDEFAGSRRRLVNILKYSLAMAESEAARGSALSDFGASVKHAISVMGKTASPSATTDVFVATVSSITKPFSARHVARNVKMKVLKTLGVGGTSVIFEVEPLEERVKRLLGCDRLAMKVFFVSAKKVRSAKHLEEGASAVQQAVDSDRRTAFKLCQTYKSCDVDDLWSRLRIAHPVFIGQLSTLGAPVGRVGGEAVLPSVTFMPQLAGSCDVVFEYDESRPKEKRPFVKDAIYVVREALKSVSLINGAGLVHCDLKLKNILIGDDGRIVVGDLNAATEPGTPVQILTRFFLPPESRASPVEIASYAHDSWALGLTAYFVITGELPYQGSLQSGADRRRKYSKLLNYKSPMERGRKILFPAYKLREMNTPQVWIEIICALLEPDPSKRPTVPQVVAGFPEIFAE